ncbi:MAG: anion transporter [Spirochaetia bacterium]|nr:anion transporter [Spirochaetia bacterium]
MDTLAGAARELGADLLIVVAIAGIAAGRLPRLRMNRPTMAVAAAAALVAAGAISFEEALAAVDGGTLVLLFAMMVLVANLRLSGFFELAGARALAAARTPRSLLAAVVLVSGVLSALFLNDTMCLMLTPLVAGIALAARRDAVPYLIAVAAAANVGSAATIIGNPQNMLIGEASGISFARFAYRLAPPALLGLAACWILVVLAFPKEFGRGARLDPPPAGPVTIDRRLLVKSLAAAALMLALFLAGVPVALAALSAASLLLVTRRTAAETVLREVDFGLLVFFAGLFAVTRAVENTLAFQALAQAALPGATASPAAFAGFSALLSNLVSNVPAVMLLKPLAPAFPDPEKAWLTLAMSSTFAGNLTLLGSVANLIVAEGAKPFGVTLGFGRYLRVGLPLTLITLAIGTAWLALT